MLSGIIRKVFESRVRFSWLESSGRASWRRHRLGWIKSCTGSEQADWAMRKGTGRTHKTVSLRDWGTGYVVTKAVETACKGTRKM